MQKNPDVTKVFGDDTKAAEQHYIDYGMKEGRDCTCGEIPSYCNWDCYLLNNEDVRKVFGANNVNGAR